MKAMQVVSLVISFIALSILQIPLALGDVLSISPPAIPPIKPFNNCTSVRIPPASPFANYTSTKDICAYSPPPSAILNRPTDAAPLCVPAFVKLQTLLKSGGSTPIIVRLKEPVGYSSTFQIEGKLAGPQVVDAQRTAIQRVQDTLLKRVSAKNAQYAKKYKYIPFMALTVDQADFNQLLNAREIDLIEEDVPVSPALPQSVPLIGVNGNWTFSGFSGSGQAVAILDTGVDFTHPFLAGKDTYEACFSTTDTFAGYDPTIGFYTYNTTTVCPNGQGSMDGHGAGANCTISGCDHGTHVAGIAAGKGSSFSGVAKDANIISIQVYSRVDSATKCGIAGTPCILAFTSDWIHGLESVFSLRNTNTIAAVNMSLGGSRYNAYCDNVSVSAKAAIDNLRTAGIATVIASGNDGDSSQISYPACISSSISVGATTKSDTVASFSNSASILNLLAPGSSIYSSVPGNNYASCEWYLDGHPPRYRGMGGYQVMQTYRNCR